MSCRPSGFCELVGAPSSCPNTRVCLALLSALFRQWEDAGHSQARLGSHRLSLLLPCGTAVLEGRTEGASEASFVKQSSFVHITNTTSASLPSFHIEGAASPLSSWELQNVISSSPWIWTRDPRSLPCLRKRLNALQAKMHVQKGAWGERTGAGSAMETPAQGLRHLPKFTRGDTYLPPTLLGDSPALGDGKGGWTCSGQSRRAFLAHRVSLHHLPLPQD